MLSNYIRLAKKLLLTNWGILREYQERRNYHRLPAEYWEGLPDLVLNQQAPVFFLSTGRCGTALLTQIFDRLPGVQCHHAPRPELLYSERLAYEFGHCQFEAFRTAVLTARFELMADSLVRGRSYVETNYRMTFFAPHLRSLFPKAKFVHLVRHPGDFVTSAVRSRYYLGQYTDIGRIRPVHCAESELWPEMSHIERCAWLWNETNGFIERFKEDCEPSQVMTVKAESLFRYPHATRDILAHCDIASPPLPTLERWIRRRVNSQSDFKSFPAFKNWSDAQKGELRRWCAGAARYEYCV